MRSGSKWGLIRFPVALALLSLLALDICVRPSIGTRLGRYREVKSPRPQPRQTRRHFRSQKPHEPALNCDVLTDLGG